MFAHHEVQFELKKNHYFELKCELSSVKEEAKIEKLLHIPIIIWQIIKLKITNLRKFIRTQQVIYFNQLHGKK